MPGTGAGKKRGQAECRFCLGELMAQQVLQGEVAYMIKKEENRKGEPKKREALEPFTSYLAQLDRSRWRKLLVGLCLGS